MLVLNIINFIIYMLCVFYKYNPKFYTVFRSDSADTKMYAQFNALLHQY